MGKKSINPTNLFFPLPVALVSCQDDGGRQSIITMSSICPVSANPPMIGMAVRPERYSYDIIKKSGEFVVNIPSENLLKISDYCGVASGKNVNKFESAQLTPAPCEKLKAPLILECPVNIGCVVKQIVRYGGTHDFFVGEVVSIQADEGVLRTNESSVDFQKFLPFALCMCGKGVFEYWGLRERIEKYGYTKGKL
jgi:flavin reductase (DIM6/NTAB) family NADH-FMN oxidoreductase RutF